MILLLAWTWCVPVGSEPVRGVPIVASDASWSAALPGEPELRQKGRTRSWTYLDGSASTLFMVVEASGWPLASDESGWRKTAGAVVAGLTEGKPVEVRPEEFQGRPACRLQTQTPQGKALKGLAVRVDESRHILLLSVPMGETEPVSEAFFATLAVPATVPGHLVSCPDWSLIFPQAPQGSPPDVQLSCPDGSRYSAREQLSDHPLEDFQTSLHKAGRISGQRSYTVEGKPMHQYTVRAEDGRVSYHRLVLLSERRALWLTAEGLDAAAAQAFFTSLRIWKP
jgi:hypothetical protein